MHKERWVGIAVLAIASIACGSRGPRVLPRTVRLSVQRDYPDCRGRDIRGYELGSHRYQVTGCGLDVVYLCPGRRRPCVPEQAAGAYVVAAPPSAAIGVIVVTGGASGPETIQTYPAQYPAGTASAGATAAATASAGPTSSPAPASAPSREQIEAGIGAWIDTHASEILQCTGTQAALIEVRWDASGAPAIALGGEMHGSPGEPCVQRVLSGVQLNVGGQAGSVRHVVSAGIDDSEDRDGSGSGPLLAPG